MVDSTPEGRERTKSLSASDSEPEPEQEREREPEPVKGSPRFGTAEWNRRHGASPPAAGGDEVAAVVAMGFDSVTASMALSKCGGDVERAVEHLLTAKVESGSDLAGESVGPPAETGTFALLEPEPEPTGPSADLQRKLEEAESQRERILSEAREARERLVREAEEEQSAQSLLTKALHEELQQLKQHREEDKEEQRQREAAQKAARESERQRDKEEIARLRAQVESLESRPAESTSPSNDAADLSAAIEALTHEEAEREFPADVDGPLQPQEWLLRPGLEPEPGPAD